jgi:hypothetical protein
MLVTDYYNRLENNRDKLLKAIIYTSNLHDINNIILETDYSIGGDLIYNIIVPSTFKFRIVFDKYIFNSQLSTYTFKFSIKDKDINNFYLNAINYI